MLARDALDAATSRRSIHGISVSDRFVSKLPRVLWGLTVVAVLHRLPFRLPQGSWRVMSYAIGSAAAFWTIDRVVSIVQTAA